MIIEHNPRNPPLASWLQEYIMPLLHSSSRMKRAVSEPPMVGERNCTNLRNMLMPSKLQTPLPTHTASSSDNEGNGCHKCKSKRCIVCAKHLKEASHFTSATNITKYFIKEHLTCISTNLVYLIDCARCGKVQYVGETQQTLRKRLYGHRHNIKHFDPAAVADPSVLDDIYRQDTMVAKHFNEPGHSIDDMKCMAIEQIRVQDSSVRKHRKILATPTSNKLS